MARATTRQISFADWELMQQHVQLEPGLQAISDFLDDQKDIIACIRRDLVRGLKNPGSGRSGFRILAKLDGAYVAVYAASQPRGRFVAQPFGFGLSRRYILDDSANGG